MTRGRPARPDEIPRYGSIWTYVYPDLCYLALGLTDDEWFVAIRIEPGTEPEVGAHLIWRTSRQVLPSWRCIDEGPE